MFFFSCGVHCCLSRVPHHAMWPEIAIFSVNAYIRERKKIFSYWASDYKWNFPCSNFQLMRAALIPYNTAWYGQNWIWISALEQAWLTWVRWTRVIPFSSSCGGSWQSWGITGCTQISIKAVLLLLVFRRTGHIMCIK